MPCGSQNLPDRRCLEFKQLCVLLGRVNPPSPSTPPRRVLMHTTQRFATSLFALAATLASASASADIVIGVAGPMSGQYASGGEQMRNGVEAAVTTINAAGGINGQKLRIEVGDDACDPKQAVAVANAMVNKKVSAIVGH